MRTLGKALSAKFREITPVFIAGMTETVVANLCTCYCKPNDSADASKDAGDTSNSSNG